MKLFLSHRKWCSAAKPKMQVSFWCLEEAWARLQSENAFLFRCIITDLWHAIAFLQPHELSRSLPVFEIFWLLTLEICSGKPVFVAAELIWVTDRPLLL